MSQSRTERNNAFVGQDNVEGGEQEEECCHCSARLSKLKCERLASVVRLMEVS